MALDLQTLSFSCRCQRAERIWWSQRKVTPAYTIYCWFSPSSSPLCSPHLRHCNTHSRCDPPFIFQQPTVLKIAVGSEMGLLLSKCYSHLENYSTRATIRVGYFQVDNSKQKSEKCTGDQILSRWGSWRILQNCAWILLFRGLFLFFLFMFHEHLRRFFGTTSSPVQDDMWEVFFSWDARPTKHIDRVKLEKTKDFNHDYGKYFINFKHSGLGQYVKNIRLTVKEWQDTIHLSPSLIHSSISPTS